MTESDDFRLNKDNDIRYIAISDVDYRTMQVVSQQIIKAHQAPSRATYRLQTGDIITAVSGASTGTIKQASALITEEENNAIFDKLYASKGIIEQDFCEPLEWQRLEGKKACRIMKTIDIGGYRDDESKWPEIQDAMVDAMIRLEKALRPHIESL